MPDKYGFDHLINRGTITVKCIEHGCEIGGYLWEWEEDRRRVHFFTHNFEIDEQDRPVIMGQKRTTICRICGSSFDQERKRGRPRVVCTVCKP